MKPNSADAVVTDPPYGLEFMGKEWDKLGKINSGRSRTENEITAISRGPETYKAGIEAQLWHIQWLTEAYRILKPGGSMLVMGGTRTSHRLACAIEDTGFIIKDTLMFMYGSGFPKAQEVSVFVDAKMLGITTKQVKERREVIGKRCKHHPDTANWSDKSNPYPETTGDVPIAPGTYEENYTLPITKPLTPEAKHWDGFKVGGIKPAYEPIIWAVKPPEGSYVDNVLKWGVGAVNVDECRVGLNNNDHKGKGGGGVHEHWVGKDMENRIYGKIKRTDVDHAKGRFPANVILDEEAGRMLDEQSGILRTGCKLKRKIDYNRPGKMLSKWQGRPETVNRINNEYGGASRFFKVVDLNDSFMHNKVLCKYNINGNISGQKKVAGMLNGVIKRIEKSIHSVEQLGYGNNITENSQKDLKLTISILIKQMIELRISLFYLNENTGNYTEELEKTINSLMELNVENAKSAKHINHYRDSLKERLEHIKVTVRTVKEKLCENGKKRIESISTPICENIANDNPSILNQGNPIKVRFLYCAKASRGERNAGLEGMEDIEKHGHYAQDEWSRKNMGNLPDEKRRPVKNNHPTVKPIKLFEWLIKLVTREGQIVLDPFIGSGTTAIAAHNTGRKCIGIEKEDEYIEIAKKRISYWQNQPKQNSLNLGE